MFVCFRLSGGVVLPVQRTDHQSNQRWFMSNHTVPLKSFRKWCVLNRMESNRIISYRIAECRVSYRGISVSLQPYPLESPPLLSSMSKTSHSCKVIACCAVKCFSMLEVFPPFDVIKALHVLQLALVLSFLVKYNQTLECFCLDAMLETFWAKIRSVHMTSSRKCIRR